MSPPPETFCEAQRHRTPVPAARWSDLVGMHLCNACYQKVHRETKGQGTGAAVVAGLRNWLTEGGVDRARTVRLKGPPQVTPENAELLDRMATERGMTQYGYMSDGPVEGMNNRLKVVTRRAYGFRTFRAIEIALYHAPGKLPDPQDSATHKFC